MTLSDLASLGGFISGVAVVITLIFLLLQMRQNNSQMQMAELNSAQMRFAGFRLAIVDNREVAQLWIVGKGDGSLDEIDEERFSNLLNDFFWSVFNVWDRHTRGGISTDIPSAVPYLGTLFVSKRVSGLWQRFKTMFPPSFIQAVDEAAVAAQVSVLPSH